MKKCELSSEFKQQLKRSISKFEEKLKTPHTCSELSCEFERLGKESNIEFEEKKKDSADLRCKIISLAFKQQLKKSIFEFEEKLKTPPTRDEQAEFEEKLKKDRSDLSCILQDMESEAEALIKNIDSQESIVKKWWKKWQKKGKRDKELAQIMQVMQQQAEQELRKLNLPPNGPHNYHFNYWPSFFSSFALM